MHQKAVGEYMVAGNDHVAIAIHITNPQDAHWFTPGRNVFDDGDETAWAKAEAWAAPGVDTTCPKCGGIAFYRTDEAECTNCGSIFVHYPPPLKGDHK